MKALQAAILRLQAQRLRLCQLYSNNGNGRARRRPLGKRWSHRHTRENFRGRPQNVSWSRPARSLFARHPLGIENEILNEGFRGLVSDFIFAFIFNIVFALFKALFVHPTTKSHNLLNSSKWRKIWVPNFFCSSARQRNRKHGHCR